MTTRFGRSIRFKITIIVFLTTLFTITISWSLSYVFIEQFYVTHTKNMLIQTYNSCNEFFSDEDNIAALNNGEIVSLYGYINNPSNATVFVIEPKRFKVYSSVQINNETVMGLKDIIDSYDLNKFKYGEKSYNVVRNSVQSEADDSNITGQYYDLVGMLDNEYLIVLRSSVESISENINFAARLFASISIALLTFEVLIVLIVTNMFSRPVIEMSRVARRMSNMDFSAKVDIKTDDELGELGESMNIMSVRLEKTIKDLKIANLELSNDIKQKEHIEDMRSEFVSHVSHELKTPLAIIQGYAEGLKTGVAVDQESRDYYCDVIIDESAKMNEMVMRLIDLNQIESGNDLNLERFDITRLIQDVINNSHILIQDNRADIIFDEVKPYYVWADSFMAEEVITNYLSNAIHYVRDDGRIKIWIEDRDKVVRINVYNDGDRISDDDLDKLFIKFYKSDEARSRSYGGSGIGLSIVAAIMKAHNKDYGVYNMDEGVVFYFELDTNNSV